MSQKEKQEILTAVDKLKADILRQLATLDSEKVSKLDDLMTQLDEAVQGLNAALVKKDNQAGGKRSTRGNKQKQKQKQKQNKQKKKQTKRR